MPQHPNRRSLRLPRAAVGLLILVVACASAAPKRAPAPVAPHGISAGMFLIASGYFMTDPRFSRSVVLIVRHVPDKGTLGLILNHPTQMNVRQALPDLAGSAHLTLPLYLGGPVSPKGYFLLVRTNEPADGLERVMKDVSFSSNLDSISGWLDRESRPNRIRVFAGYSGWGPGQLAAEIERNGWRLIPADAATVFDTAPEDLWQELLQRGPALETAIPAPSPVPVDAVKRSGSTAMYAKIAMR